MTKELSWFRKPGYRTAIPISVISIGDLSKTQASAAVSGSATEFLEAVAALQGCLYEGKKPGKHQRCRQAQGQACRVLKPSVFSSGLRSKRYEYYSLSFIVLAKICHSMLLSTLIDDSGSISAKKLLRQTQHILAEQSVTFHPWRRGGNTMK